jgi:uncharacterized protein
MSRNPNRRRFVKSAALAGTALSLATTNVFSAAANKPRKALLVWGGWKGHAPEACKDLFEPWLKKIGWDVVVSNTLDSYADEKLMDSLDVVIQIWTMGEIGKEQSKGLIRAVKEKGVGMAGWHGGMCDSFRSNTGYQYMTGGQWVAHPGGGVDYEVNITDHEDPITKGLQDFNMHSEQYYMHVDPAVKVIATTTFNGDHNPWVDGVVMPVVWKKIYGKGRIFYSTLGHNVDDFKVPEALEITQRGILWAAESKHEKTPNLVSPAYPSR